MIISEEVVSITTAKLLKAKGFNEICRQFYTKSRDDEGRYIVIEPTIPDNFNNEIKYKNMISYIISAPTQYQVIDWFKISKQNYNKFLETVVKELLKEV